MGGKGLEPQNERAKNQLQSKLKKTFKREKRPNGRI